MKVYVSVQSRYGDDDFTIFGVYYTLEQAIEEAKRWLISIIGTGILPMVIDRYTDGASIYQDEYFFDIQEEEIQGQS